MKISAKPRHRKPLRPPPFTHKCTSIVIQVHLKIPAVWNHLMELMHNSALSILLRKVPKVTTLVAFGFSTLPLSLLSEARYFWGVVTFGWLKRVLNMGTFKKMWKKAMYRNVKQIIINKPRISVEINLFRVNLSYIRYFWQKGKLVLPRAIQHSLFWRYANCSK